MAIKKNYFVVLAGGSGRRMQGSSVPKQFIVLDGIPIIIRTLQNVMSYPFLDEFIIAINKDYRTEFENMLQNFRLDLSKITIVDGGGERADSISHSIQAITSQNEEIHADSVVLLHDAVRPFIAEKTVKNCIDNALQFGASVTAIHVVDSLAYSPNWEQIESVQDRSKYCLLQTPDAIRVQKFVEILASIPENEKSKYPGTIDLFAYAGLKPAIAESDSLNIKITTPTDLDIAKGILAGKSEAK